MGIPHHQSITATAIRFQVKQYANQPVSTAKMNQEGQTQEGQTQPGQTEQVQTQQLLLKKIIVVPSHHMWRHRSSSHGGGMYRDFVPEAAFEADSNCAGYVMCCNGLQMPRPEDYDTDCKSWYLSKTAVPTILEQPLPKSSDVRCLCRNGVAYVLPHAAEPIAVPP